MPPTTGRSVFETYAHEYDLITSAAQREPNHRKEVTALIERFQPRTVLDAGCAAGLTASLFAREGVKAVGLDRSRRVLAVARKKYQSTKLPLTFRYGSFEALPSNLTGRFDLVVCLANSISGVGSTANLRKAISGFRNSLSPGGWLVLQLLNISSLTDGASRPVKATRHGDIVYQRFMERHGKTASLYVLRTDFSVSPPVLEVFRHDHDSFDTEQVDRACHRAGLTGLRRYSDLQMSKRFRSRSRDLVVIGRRPV